ncbi:MAG: TatD family hydrolase [Dehalococcoidia bacterium]|nr:TatD family hydrolase [Dehalococcoidia bacterium]MDH4292400.1 TatD family hydrolase [Dehalococcoidia bacterium]
MHKLIDTHAHLDELQNLDSMLGAARTAGVIAVVAVGSNHQSNIKTLEISQKRGYFVYPALGLHPWELANLGPFEIDDNLRFIEQNIASAVAVGEIGLDYDKRVLKVASKELQQEVLGRLLNIARKYAKPAIIHSRYAWKDALSLVQDVGIDRAVFHWFTGFSSVLKDIIDGGYFVSATPAAEYHEEHRRAVKEAPLQRLLLETDCPVTYGREARYESQPIDVLRGLKAVSQLKGVEEAIIAEHTTRNAIGFFSLDIEIQLRRSDP